MTLPDPEHPFLIPRRDGVVLVLRALGLGDALTGVAALRGLRRAFPGRLLVLAAPDGVGRWLRDLGLVDGVLPTTGLAPLRWDAADHVAVNLHGRGPQSHRILAATAPAQLVAFANEEAGHQGGPAWRADEHEVERWCRLVTAAGGACGPEDLRLPGHRPEPTDEVVVHPGAASRSRRWPVDRWARLVRHLVEGGHHVVLTGGPEERRLCADVMSAAGLAPGGRGRHRAADPDVPWDQQVGGHLTTSGRRAGTVRSTAGLLDLPALADVVDGARLVVCGDTGVAHLATAYATPSVLLFGPTPPQRWGPLIDPHIHTVLWHGETAQPGDPHGDEVDPALAAITPGEVIESVESLLRR